MVEDEGKAKVKAKGRKAIVAIIATFAVVGQPIGADFSTSEPFPRRGSEHTVVVSSFRGRADRTKERPVIR
jgi:hypothetical protein